MSAAIGVAARIAGLELSYPGLAHWGVAVIAAAVTGAAADLLPAVAAGRHMNPSLSDHA